MNAATLLSRGAASRAASGLNHTLNEIAAEVRGLKIPATAAPGAGAVPAMPEGSETNSELNPAQPIPLEPRPPAASATTAATGRSSVENQPSWEVPVLGDLRPELAAFVATTVQQHQATVKALQQVTESCRLQQGQIERLAQRNAELTNRLRVQAQMM